MILWLILAVLTIAALAFLLVPLFRHRNTVVDREVYDLNVYKDQLAEVERDIERGLLEEEDAAAARLEIQRRILSLDKHKAKRDRRRGDLFAVEVLAAAIAVMLPLSAIGIYWAVGSPAAALMTPEERQAQNTGMTGEQAQQVLKMVEGLAARMVDSPEDKDGWLMLARSYVQLGRNAEAAQAYGRAIDLGVDDPETLTLYGITLTKAAGDTIPPQARLAFLRILKAEPANPDALYYLGMVEIQENRPEAAIAIWKQLQANSPPDAPWLGEIASLIEGVSTDYSIDAATVEPKAPDTSAVPAPGKSRAEQQREMVDKMVARLEDKLKADPANFDGWMQLGQSTMVLGRFDEARAAYDKAAALQPDNVDTKLAMVSLILQQSPTDRTGALPEEAVALMRRVLEIDPNNKDALYFLGFAEKRGGNKEGARGFWTKLRDMLPEGSADRKEVEGFIAELDAP